MPSLMCPMLRPGDKIEVTMANGITVRAIIPNSVTVGLAQLHTPIPIVKYVILERDGWQMHEVFIVEGALQPPPPAPYVDDSEEVDFDG